MIPLLCIVGPTASGKTSLAVELALRLRGEVVSADSMQLYKGMDIATAKPDAAEMKGVPHHLLSVMESDSEFSVADYAAMARPVIADIAGRGKLPILAGGTGLYISSILDNTCFCEAPADPELRNELNRLAAEKGNGAVHEILRSLDPQAAERLHRNNLGRVIRAIEVCRATGLTTGELERRSHISPPPYDAMVIGITFRERAALYRRIDARVDNMMERGLEEEARRMLAGKLSSTAAQAIGYKELAPFFRGEAPLEECVDKLKQGTRRYAKRQLTWFRRDGRVNWLYADELTAEELVSAALELYAAGPGGLRGEKI